MKLIDKDPDRIMEEIASITDEKHKRELVLLCEFGKRLQETYNNFFDDHKNEIIESELNDFHIAHIAPISLVGRVFINNMANISEEKREQYESYIQRILDGLLADAKLAYKACPPEKSH